MDHFGFNYSKNLSVGLKGLLYSENMPRKKLIIIYVDFSTIKGETGQ